MGFWALEMYFLFILAGEVVGLVETFLRFVHFLVDAEEKIVQGVAAIEAIFEESHGNAEEIRAFFGLLLLCERFVDLPDEGFADFIFRGADENQEFVPGVSDDISFFADDRNEGPRGFNQSLIPHLVAELVIDVLEIIQVDHDRGEADVFEPITLLKVDEIGAVVQTGERVAIDGLVLNRQEQTDDADGHGRPLQGNPVEAGLKDDPDEDGGQEDDHGIELERLCMAFVDEMIKDRGSQNRQFHHDENVVSGKPEIGVFRGDGEKQGKERIREDEDDSD